MKTFFRIFFLVSCFSSASPSWAESAVIDPEVVHFTSGELKLRGELFKPKGDGPFPVVIYNHGSAPGMLNSQASKAIAPLFVEKGWVFFMPYRRGQGLSSTVGKFVDTKKIAVAGNSFGGIETVLGAAREPYCAAIAAAAGAESWSVSPDLQLIMKKAVGAAKSPIHFFQAENDFDLSPSRTLHSEMKAAGKMSEI